MSDAAPNLYAEPVGLPDPFSESHRLSNTYARAREICGLSPHGLSESHVSGLPAIARDDLVAMYEHRQKLLQFVMPGEQNEDLDLGQVRGVEQR